MGFCSQYRATFVLNWDPTSMFILGDFSKVMLWLQRGLDFSSLGVQVGSKTRPKIYQKTESKTECILASIFQWFCQIFDDNMASQIHPRRCDWPGMASWPGVEGVTGVARKA